MNKTIIHTNDAPQAIGPYSQAVKVGDLVFLSGQIALTADGTFINGSIDEQLQQIFTNISAVCSASGGDLSSIVKLTVYLTDMNDFESVNKTMSQFMSEPYPARAAVAVAQLPKNAAVELDAILSLT